MHCKLGQISPIFSRHDAPKGPEAGCSRCAHSETVEKAKTKHKNLLTLTADLDDARKLVCSKECWHPLKDPQGVKPLTHAP